MKQARSGIVVGQPRELLVVVFRNLNTCADSDARIIEQPEPTIGRRHGDFFS